MRCDLFRAETLTRSEGNLLKSFYIAVNPEAFDNECWKVIVVRGLLEESMKLGQEINKFGSYLVCTANPLIQVNIIYIFSSFSLCMQLTHVKTCHLFECTFMYVCRK